MAYICGNTNSQFSKLAFKKRHTLASKLYQTVYHKQALRTYPVIKIYFQSLVLYFFDCPAAYQCWFEQMCCELQILSSVKQSYHDNQHLYYASYSHLRIAPSAMQLIVELLPHH